MWKESKMWTQTGLDFSHFQPKSFSQAMYEALVISWTHERNWDSDFFIFRSIKPKEIQHVQKRSYKSPPEKSVFYNGFPVFLVCLGVSFFWLGFNLFNDWFSFLCVCIFSTYRTLNTHYLGEHFFCIQLCICNADFFNLEKMK